MVLCILRLTSLARVSSVGVWVLLMASSLLFVWIVMVRGLGRRLRV